MPNMRILCKGNNLRGPDHAHRPSARALFDHADGFGGRTDAPAEHLLTEAQVRSLPASLDLSRRPRSVAEAGEGLSGAAPGEDAVLVGKIPAGGVAPEKFVTVTGGGLLLSLFRRVFPEIVQR